MAGQSTDGHFSDEINLKIESIEEDLDLYEQIQSYFELLKDYMYREDLLSFIHTEEYF